MDGTRETVRKLANELNTRSFSIELINESDFGEQPSSGNARNIGCRLAKGRKVVFMDPDMSFVSTDALSTLSRKLDHVVFTRVRTRIVLDTELEKFLALAHPRYHNCAYRREILEKVHFDPSLGFGEDQDFMYRVKRDLGVDTDEICDVTLARHLPHTETDFLLQSNWYARTMPNFIQTVVKRNERELLGGLCDWLRYWSFCFVPVLTVMVPLLSYAREDRPPHASLRFFLWNSTVRRYLSFYHFLKASARAGTLCLDFHLLIACISTRVRSRLF